VLEAVDRVSERVSFEMFRFGIYVTMPALVVLVTLDVLLRYVFNAPLEWARDTNGLLLIISLFCALPHAWDRAYHIRMEVFYDRFTTRTRRWADVLSSVSGVIFFGFMAVQAALFVPFMIQTGETGEDLDFVLWPFMGIVSFCAFVMVARVFSNPASDERRVRHHLTHGVATGAGPAEPASDAAGGGDSS
jgi:TRAP-type C4-dicarboxylate transport system permease small subunit